MYVKVRHFFKMASKLQNIIQIIIHTECDCHVMGLLTCKLNGNCTCKENVIGNTCANCKADYYGFPDCTCKFYLLNRLYFIRIFQM